MAQPTKAPDEVPDDTRVSVSVPANTAPYRAAPRTSLLTKFERFVDAPKPRTTLTALEQLSQSAPSDRLMGWVVTLVITGLAFLIRWYRIGFPSAIMFDETFYAKDAWSLVQYSYEGSWPGKADVINAQVAQGDWSALSPNASWAVHPEVGKWLIGAGEWLLGLNSFGWRFGALVFGTLLVFMVIRLARRLSRSTMIGGLAGLLLTVDGLSFVLSRIALLDIFQAFFIVAAVAAVVADRDFFRNRLADRIATLPGQTLGGRPGPYIFRPWLLVAGVMFGLACGTKWNSVYPLAVFGVMVVVYSIGARRLAGARGRAYWGVLSDGVPAFISLVVVGLGTYLATWIPWLRASGGYQRNWGEQHPDSWVVKHFGEALASLWQWHVVTYQFHTGPQMTEATHTYASNPWGWLVMYRTTGIYAQNGIQPGQQGCAAVGDTCMRVVTALGTPLLWWGAALALIAGLVWWLAGMDWRFGVVVLGVFSTWIPWIFADRGAMFSFYSITMIPFMCIGLAMALGVILGPARRGLRRQTGAIAVGTYVALVVLDFAFIYPVLTGKLMTWHMWAWRMWLPGWV